MLWNPLKCLGAWTRSLWGETTEAQMMRVTPALNTTSALKVSLLLMLAGGAGWNVTLGEDSPAS